MNASPASRRAVALAVLLGMTYMYPAYLVGTLGVAIREDIGLDSAGLGLTVSLFYAVGAVAMSPGGRIADRMGARRALRLSAVLTGACLAGVALFGGTWPGLLAALAVGGIGSAVGAPIGTVLIVAHVRAARRPMAFGLERSSIPASTLVAGLALPLLAAVMHWRLVFLVGGVAVAALLLSRVPDVAAGPETAPAGRRDRLRLTPLVPLLLVTGAFLLGSAAATAMSSFFVEYGVTLGLSPSVAGLALALTSAVVIAVRLALGRSRYGRLTVAVMMALGSAGFLLFVPGERALFLLGALVACGAGWGWTGLVALTVAETYAAMPGAATGVLQSGGAAGGILGPLAVGAAAQYHSYAAGWLLAAAFCGLAALLVLANRAVWKVAG
ncbi:MFS transporter [Herbidospora yilanensis]|uniref:MFS transporter n=1 Tax=Herbidospora yilanensis TaxID=354426 RepID=UPI0007862BB4|nr:MFS transporter [Herbidospora yilanensis]